MGKRNAVYILLASLGLASVTGCVANRRINETEEPQSIRQRVYLAPDFQAHVGVVQGTNAGASALDMLGPFEYRSE